MVYVLQREIYHTKSVQKVTRIIFLNHISKMIFLNSYFEDDNIDNIVNFFNRKKKIILITFRIDLICLFTKKLN